MRPRATPKAILFATLVSALSACGGGTGPHYGAAGTAGSAAGHPDGAAGSGGNTAGTVGDAGPASGGADGATDADTANVLVQEILWTPSRDLDLLFMIDDSSSMTALQAKLVAQFPTFMNTLKALPGGLPNLHLAIVSSDMGAGAATGVQSCPVGGDRGVFQTKPRGSCMTSGLAPGQNFISNIGGTANYTGDITDVFSCLALLGDQGCGAEAQLGSVVRALGADGMPVPTENAGFLRPDAFLGIILLTNEDDCSMPANSDLFDPSSQLVSDPLGPLQSYRCNEFGHLCGGKRPPRTMAADLSGTCHSAEDGILLRISDIVTELQQLKTDPTKIVVSAIAAPPSPYVVMLEPPPIPDPSQWPVIGHSCMGTDGSFGDPGVRLADLLDAFGTNGSFQSICDLSLQPAVEAIANRVGGMTPPCLEAKVVDADVTTPGLQASCTLVDHVVGAGGLRVDTPVPACAQNGNTAPCWSLALDAACGAGGWLVKVAREGIQPTSLTTTVTCQVCAAGDQRAGCRGS